MFDIYVPIDGWRLVALTRMLIPGTWTLLNLRYPCTFFIYLELLVTAIKIRRRRILIALVSLWCFLVFYIYFIYSLIFLKTIARKAMKIFLRLENFSRLFYKKSHFSSPQVLYFSLKRQNIHFIL